MTNMTSKEKLQALALLCNDPDIHNVEKALIEAYNLALEDAAKSATVTSVAVGGDPPRLRVHSR